MGNKKGNNKKNANKNVQNNGVKTNNTNITPKNNINTNNSNSEKKDVVNKPKNNNQKQNNNSNLKNNNENKQVTNNSKVNSNSNIQKNINKNPNANYQKKKKNNHQKNLQNQNNTNNVKNVNPNNNSQNSKPNINKQNSNKVNNKPKNNNNQKQEQNSQKINIKNKNVNSNNNVKTEENKNSKVVKENVANLNKEKNENIEKKEENKTKTNTSILIIVLILLAFLVCVVGLFLLNFFGNKIQPNIYIQDVNVSNLTKEDAKNKIIEEYSNIIGKQMKYSFNEKEYQINLDEIEFSLRVDEALNNAMAIGRNENLFIAGFDFYKQIFGNTENINLNFDYNKDKLYSKITEIEKDFIRPVEQFSYNTDNDVLTIKRGVPGIKVDYEKIELQLGEAVERKDLEKTIQIPISIEEPEDIDTTKIHNEVFVDMKNAYYTLNPFEIHTEIRGVNFDLAALNQMIATEPDKAEYSIPLLITEPTIRVENLDLYQDELGSCATYYVNNPNRTQNLRLAASKVNDYILMPGEVFSYNDTVGERTIAAGYRSAAIYVNGEVEDGVGGGICQISSTIYNAVVEADLEIVERSNHARVPSYLPAGKDATVYWGSKDFQFKNNRSYPIKITVTVEGGLATARIFGTRTENEYDISIETGVISRYNGYLVVNAYKVYRQNGEEVKRELLSTDSYKIG